MDHYLSLLAYMPNMSIGQTSRKIWTGFLFDHHLMTLTTIDGRPVAGELPEITGPKIGSCIMLSVSLSPTPRVVGQWVDCYKKIPSFKILCDYSNPIVFKTTYFTDNGVDTFAMIPLSIQKYYIGPTVSLTSCLAYCSSVNDIKTVLVSTHMCSCLSCKYT